MSKLEDKLAASMTPETAGSSPKTATSSRKSRTSNTPSAAGKIDPPAASLQSEPDLNHPSRPLHPRRIWPD